MKVIVKYIDDILLALGMAFISLGGFLVYLPIGFFIIGACFIAYAFVFAKLAAKRGGS